MATDDPAKLDNPWVGAECARLGLAPNGLPTYLQQQYGQLGEDLVLEALLKAAFAARGLGLEQVRYLEVGANHPVQTSNTYLFYRKWGGQGVLVDANPALLPALRQARPRDTALHLAIVPQPGVDAVQFHVAQHGELSSLDPGHMQSFGALGQPASVVQVPAMTLDALMRQHCPAQLHLMSIDIEGVDLQVLAATSLPVRPWLVVAEPSRHYHRDAEASFRQVMADKGYVELARTDYNLLFADTQAFGASLGLRVPGAESAQAALAPGAVRSFDIFDTLLARRCISAEGIFHELERRTGVRGLAQLRWNAERAVEGGEYTLAHIYQQMAQATGMRDDVAQQLMGMELALELDNVVPMADNLRQLTSDSLLVTDMYLPRDAIRAMLAKAGVPPQQCLLHSARGKRDGTVWRALAAAGTTCEHLGDHPVSDHQQPLAAGMRAHLTTLAQPTALEQRWLQCGAVKLAQTLRAARLAVGSAGLPPHLHTLQAQLNLPLLLVSALHLRGLCQAEGVGRVLFSSRDGYHLHTLFGAAMAAGRGGAGGAGGAGVQAAYWYTSRLARARGSAGYLDYCRSMFTPGSLVVDLCGTGISLAALRARLGLAEADLPLFVSQRIVPAPGTEAGLQARYGLAQYPAPRALWTNHDMVPNELLEMLNYVPEGMVADVVAVPGGFAPQRAALEFAPDVLALVQAQTAFITACAATLRQADVAGATEEVMRLSTPVCAAVGQHAQALLPELSTLHTSWSAGHRASEALLTTLWTAR